MGEPRLSVQRLSGSPSSTAKLISLGVCHRCLLRIAGEVDPATLRIASQLLKGREDHQPDIQADRRIIDSLTEEELGNSVCPCCFGLLQRDFCNRKFLEQISQHVKDNGYRMTVFWVSLTLPNSADIRGRAFDEFWDESAVGPAKFPRLSVKDAWKAVVTPILTPLLNATWVGHEGLEINLTIQNLEMEGETEVLKKRFPKAFQEKRGADGKVKRVITRHALEKIMANISSEEFRQLVAFPPKAIGSASVLTQISCLPCALFIAGRYLKYSRFVSQTPWFIEEERKGETSVEELICSKIRDAFQAQSFRFSTSGREDIDVLMLGDGRPFAVELIDAKLSAVSHRDMVKLEETINSLTKDIEVRYLQQVSRTDMSVIKLGEEEKTKTYSALCSTRQPVTAADLALLNSLADLTVTQKTPVRVLHRRVNAERSKVIHEVTAVLVDDPCQFRLCIKTQAGTYIKEFIHGDFGRTSPSVSSILGRETECDELDVTIVDLEWPPPRMPSLML